jgi:hypothetical protein
MQGNNPVSTNYHKNKHETKPPILFQIHAHRYNARFSSVSGRLDSQECLRRPGDLFASVNGNHQNGGGSIFQYAPNGTHSIFASNLDRPRGLAFDNAGNLFVATTTLDNSFNFQGTIFKITPGGMMSTFATGFGTNCPITRYG